MNAFLLRRVAGFAWLPGLLALAACQPAPAPQPGAERPAQAVLLLAQRLRADDAAGFAAIALPPALHAQVEGGWRTGRSRWPLEELPLDAKLPALLATLSAPGAAPQLQASFDRQFARNRRELQSAAVSLGLFGVEYLRNEGDYSDAEREHYVQAVQALSRWAAAAPLSDRTRARQLIDNLTRAARRTGIDGPDDFVRLGMEESLARIGPFLGAIKQGLKPYGLDLDDSFAGMQADLVAQTGDTAQVRLRYTLGGDPVDAIVPMRRIDGRWYLDDLLRDAEASLRPVQAPGTRVAEHGQASARAGSP
jgi:chorismate mutase